MSDLGLCAYNKKVLNLAGDLHDRYIGNIESGMTIKKQGIVKARDFHSVTDTTLYVIHSYFNNARLSGY